MKKIDRLIKLNKAQEQLKEILELIEEASELHLRMAEAAMKEYEMFCKCK